MKDKYNIMPKTLGALTGIAMGILVIMPRVMTSKEAYLAIKEKADINKDSLVSEEEWKKVYTFFGKNYDVSSSNHERDFICGEKSCEKLHEYLNLEKTLSQK